MRPRASVKSHNCFQLPWRHPDRAVDAHVFAIEITTLDHRHGNLREFMRVTKALGEWHGCGKRVFNGLRCTIHQWRVEDTRQDGVDANAFAHQVSGDWQSHAHNATL